MVLTILRFADSLFPRALTMVVVALPDRLTTKA